MLLFASLAKRKPTLHFSRVVQRCLIPPLAVNVISAMTVKKWIWIGNAAGTGGV